MMEGETIQTTRTLPENIDNNNDDDDDVQMRLVVVVVVVVVVSFNNNARIGHERRSSVHSFHRTVGTQGNGDYSFSFHHLGDALIASLGDVLLPNAEPRRCRYPRAARVLFDIHMGRRARWRDVGEAHQCATVARDVVERFVLRKRPGRVGRGVAERVEFGDESRWVVRDFNAVGFGVGFSSF